MNDYINYHFPNDFSKITFNKKNWKIKQRRLQAILRTSATHNFSCKPISLQPYQKLTVSLSIKSTLPLSFKLMDNNVCVLQESIHQDKEILYQSDNHARTLTPVVSLPIKTKKPMKIEIIFNNITFTLNKKWMLSSLPNDKYVLAKGCGGLGDLLNVYIRALYYATQTNRTLIVDWRNTIYDHERPATFNYQLCSKDQGIDIFSLFFTLPNSNFALLPKLNELSTFPSIWQDKIHYGSNHLRAEWLTTGQNPDVRSIDSNDSTEYHHMKQNMYDKIFDFNHYPIREHDQRLVVFNGPNIFNLPTELEKYLYQQIIINPNIVFIADNFWQNHKLDQDFVVCIHFRHGNGEQEIKKHTTPYMFMKFLIEIERILLKHSNPTIFLATDSSLVIDFFSNYTSEKSLKFITYDKWFPPENEGPIHKSIHNTDRLNNLKDAIIEMYLLSLGNVLIANHSSFNWWSGYNFKNPNCYKVTV